MFWGFKLREEIKRTFEKEIAARVPLVIRDEKTMSGRVHVGSLRGVAIHGIIAELLTDAGIANTFLFEINDFDPMDGLPVYVDQERYLPYMGRLLCDVPSPDETAANYAEYFANEFIQVISSLGFAPEYYRSSALYRAGKYNECIRQALDQAGQIRDIYRTVSGSKKDADWYPLQVVCEQCGKIGTTQVTGWDGKRVSYVCKRDLVKWAEGCGHQGSVDPFDGRGKLPWKVEWPAKFKVLGVHIEGAGKDHSTKGGSRDIAREIVTKVFQYPEPYNIPYGFLNVSGKKMSSSRGTGATAKEIADLLPSNLLRLLLLSKEPRSEVNFEPYGDTIPLLYDMYDRIAEEHVTKPQSEWSPAYPFLHPPAERPALTSRFLPRFSQIAYVVQMPHVKLEDAVQGMKGQPLQDGDRKELAARSHYAKQWLSLYSPERFKFEIQEQLPEEAKRFSDLQKAALRELYGYIHAAGTLEGEALHSQIHEIKKRLGILPADLFSAIYISFLGKDSGPQAGWFLTALDREFVERRLAEVSEV